MKLQEYKRNKENVRRAVECIMATKPPHPECQTCHLRGLCLKVCPGFNRRKMTLLLEDAIVVFVKNKPEA